MLSVNIPGTILSIFPDDVFGDAEKFDPIFRVLLIVAVFEILIIEVETADVLY